MTQNKNIYNVYKPLRNNLRKLCLEDSLFVIWNYTQYLQFGKKISEMIEVDPALVRSKDTISWRPHEWELELLTKEIIINSQETCSLSISLKSWHYFFNVLIKLRVLRDEIAKTYIDEENALTEFYRIAHRQFLWQSRPNLKFLFRYYKIFSDFTINDIVQKIVGINVHDLYFIGLAFIEIYSNKPDISLPLKVDLDKVGVNLDKVNIFLNFTSEKLSILKEKIVEEQEFNDKFEYSYNPIRAYPIIRMPFGGKDSLVCPMLTLLFWRITSGLYYEICDEKDFGNNFGSSFQKYIGNVIEKANNNKTINFIKEEEYYVSKNRKDTVDWIVYDSLKAIINSIGNARENSIVISIK